jgi:hypothetical protein
MGLGGDCGVIRFFGGRAGELRLPPSCQFTFKTPTNRAFTKQGRQKDHVGGGTYYFGRRRAGQGESPLGQLGRRSWPHQEPEVPAGQPGEHTASMPHQEGPVPYGLAAGGLTYSPEAAHPSAKSKSPVISQLRNFMPELPLAGSRHPDRRLRKTPSLKSEPD